MKLNELFGGMGSALARKTKAAINPTAAGQGARELEAKTNALTKNWMLYRGQSNVPQNGPAIRNWIKNKLGLDDPRIWTTAIKEYSKNYPKAAEKYLNDIALDNAEASNFFNTIIQARLRNPDTKFWQTTQKPAAKDVKDTAKSASKVKNKDDQYPEFNMYHTTANKTDDAPEEHSDIQQTETPAVPSTFAPKPTQPATVDVAEPEQEPEKTTGLDWNEIRKRFPDKT